MIRALVLATFIAGFFAFTNPKYDAPATYITVADSVHIEIKTLLDSLGILDAYSARVFTPVCEVDKCYAIEVYFYWDAIGRFLNYDTIPGSELTKLDHEPFTHADYRKLNYILSNPNSVLAQYTKEELVRDVRASDVDGMTGATIHEIKETVIEGAVYSCYTLWHIAHGEAKDSILKATRSSLDRSLVRKLVHQQDQEINYFLIDNFSKEDFAGYLPEILKAIEDGVGYFAKNAIEKLPADALQDNLSQRFFASNFSQLDYFAQVALLKRLGGVSLSQELKDALKVQLDDRNSHKNELIRQVLMSDEL